MAAIQLQITDLMNRVKAARFPDVLLRLLQLTCGFDFPDEQRCSSENRGTDAMYRNSQYRI